MDERQVVFAHISDLHFSSGTDKASTHHSHSIPHLQALANYLTKRQFDRLLVSGDISNTGDKESLLRARGWLFGELEIGGGETTGLRTTQPGVLLVPGNHDAWNFENLHSGTLLDRWQKSLTNYNEVFVEQKITHPKACYYDWLEVGGDAKQPWGIYLALVDTCFLGEAGDHHWGTGRPDQLVAKGKMSIAQSEQLLEWYDLGVRGALPYPGDDQRLIQKDLFATSLKILVMHHYLFEPPEYASDYFMRVTQRDVAFRNIAMADFDVLLCGHKHVPDFHVHAYGDHFDSRATYRHLFNCFRRVIGTYSLPLQYESNGQRLSKLASGFVNLLVLVVKRRSSHSVADAYLDELVNLLHRGLEDPASLEQDLKHYIRDYGLRGVEVVTPDELRRLNGFVRRLGARPFLQVMGGSAAKASSSRKARAFNVYTIRRADVDYVFESEQYQWNWDTNSFGEEPLKRQQIFRADRTLNL